MFFVGFAATATTTIGMEARQTLDQLRGLAAVVTRLIAETAAVDGIEIPAPRVEEFGGGTADAEITLRFANDLSLSLLSNGELQIVCDSGPRYFEPGDYDDEHGSQIVTDCAKELVSLWRHPERRMFWAKRIWRAVASLTRARLGAR